MVAFTPADARRLLDHPDRSQLLFQMKEIIDDRTYLRHGIALEPGAVVLDVGANVGVAAVFFAGICQAGAVHCFEPVGPIYETLSRNIRSLANCAAYPYGLSRSSGSTTITYYPGAAAMSGLYADPHRDQELVRRCLLNSGLSTREAEAELAGRYQFMTLSCELRTLSQALVDERIDTVHLLKIDVERAELDVLDGISDDDWPRIEQVVLEVHDQASRATAITDRLRERGFNVVLDQEPVMAGTDVKMVFAHRR
jgi:31-O-methyltransferase